MRQKGTTVRGGANDRERHGEGAGLVGRRREGRSPSWGPHGTGGHESAMGPDRGNEHRGDGRSWVRVDVQYGDDAALRGRYEPYGSRKREPSKTDTSSVSLLVHQYLSKPFSAFVLF